jgi:hypothetical protein
MTKKINKKQALELINGKQILYLIFREFKGNYYTANHMNSLHDNRTPTDSLVCETAESSDQVKKDELLLHELPKKLPSYIIEGFKKRLYNDVKKSLVKDYNAFKERECNFWELEDDILEATDAFKDAKKLLFDIINSLTNIKDFFGFAMLLQERGAINIYLLDLWKAK